MLLSVCTSSANARDACSFIFQVLPEEIAVISRSNFSFNRTASIICSYCSDVSSIGSFFYETGAVCVLISTYLITIIYLDIHGAIADVSETPVLQLGLEHGNDRSLERITFLCNSKTLILCLSSNLFALDCSLAVDTEVKFDVASDSLPLESLGKRFSPSICPLSTYTATARRGQKQFSLSGKVIVDMLSIPSLDKSAYALVLIIQDVLLQYSLLWSSIQCDVLDGLMTAARQAQKPQLSARGTTASPPPIPSSSMPPPISGSSITKGKNMLVRVHYQADFLAADFARLVHSPISALSTPYATVVTNREVVMYTYKGVSCSLLYEDIQGTNYISEGSTVPGSDGWQSYVGRRLTSAYYMNLLDVGDKTMTKNVTGHVILSLDNGDYVVLNYAAPSPSLPCSIHHDGALKVFLYLPDPCWVQLHGSQPGNCQDIMRVRTGEVLCLHGSEGVCILSGVIPLLPTASSPVPVLDGGIDACGDLVHGFPIIMAHSQYGIQHCFLSVRPGPILSSTPAYSKIFRRCPFTGSIDRMFGLKSLINVEVPDHYSTLRHGAAPTALCITGNGNKGINPSYSISSNICCSIRRNVHHAPSSFPTTATKTKQKTSMYHYKQQSVKSVVFSHAGNGCSLREDWNVITQMENGVAFMKDQSITCDGVASSSFKGCVGIQIPMDLSGVKGNMQATEAALVAENMKMFSFTMHNLSKDPSTYIVFTYAVCDTNTSSVFLWDRHVQELVSVESVEEGGETIDIDHATIGIFTVSDQIDKSVVVQVTSTRVVVLQSSNNGLSLERLQVTDISDVFSSLGDRNGSLKGLKCHLSGNVLVLSSDGHVAFLHISADVTGAAPSHVKHCDIRINNDSDSGTTDSALFNVKEHEKIRHLSFDCRGDDPMGYGTQIGVLVAVIDTDCTDTSEPSGNVESIYVYTVLLNCTGVRPSVQLCIQRVMPVHEYVNMCPNASLCCGCRSRNGDRVTNMCSLMHDPKIKQPDGSAGGTVESLMMVSLLISFRSKDCVVGVDDGDVLCIHTIDILPSDPTLGNESVKAFGMALSHSASFFILGGIRSLVWKNKDSFSAGGSKSSEGGTGNCRTVTVYISGWSKDCVLSGYLGVHSHTGNSKDTCGVSGQKHVNGWTVECVVGQVDRHAIVSLGELVVSSQTPQTIVSKVVNSFLSPAAHPSNAQFLTYCWLERTNPNQRSGSSSLVDASDLQEDHCWYLMIDSLPAANTACSGSDEGHETLCSEGNGKVSGAKPLNQWHVQQGMSIKGTVIQVILLPYAPTLSIVHWQKLTIPTGTAFENSGGVVVYTDVISLMNVTTLDIVWEHQFLPNSSVGRIVNISALRATPVDVGQSTGDKSSRCHYIVMTWQQMEPHTFQHSSSSTQTQSSSSTSSSHTPAVASTVFELLCIEELNNMGTEVGNDAGNSDAHFVLSNDMCPSVTIGRCSLRVCVLTSLTPTFDVLPSPPGQPSPTIRYLCKRYVVCATNKHSIAVIGLDTRYQAYERSLLIEGEVSKVGNADTKFSSPLTVTCDLSLIGKEPILELETVALWTVASRFLMGFDVYKYSYQRPTAQGLDGEMGKVTRAPYANDLQLVRRVVYDGCLFTRLCCSIVLVSEQSQISETLTNGLAHTNKLLRITCIGRGHQGCVAMCTELELSSLMRASSGLSGESSGDETGSQEGSETMNIQTSSTDPLLTAVAVTHGGVGMDVPPLLPSMPTMANITANPVVAEVLNPPSVPLGSSVGADENDVENGVVTPVVSAVQSKRQLRLCRVAPVPIHKRESQVGSCMEPDAASCPNLSMDVIGIYPGKEYQIDQDSDIFEETVKSNHNSHQTSQRDQLDQNGNYEPNYDIIVFSDGRYEIVY